MISENFKLPIFRSGGTGWLPAVTGGMHLAKLGRFVQRRVTEVVRLVNPCIRLHGERLLNMVKKKLKNIQQEKQRKTCKRFKNAKSEMTKEIIL